MTQLQRDPAESFDLVNGNGKADDNDPTARGDFHAFTPCHTPPGIPFPMMNDPYNRSVPFSSFETDPEEIRRVIELGAQTMTHVSFMQYG